VGRTPPNPGSPMPLELRPQADRLLARMGELEQTLSVTSRRLSLEAQNAPDTPAYYLDTKA
jgi:hypothetical protein